MPKHRQLAVKEIKRILKPTGQAYLSLGTYSPLTFVGKAEWETILEGFRVKRRGGLIQPWALVSKKDDDKDMSAGYVETTKRPRFLKLRKKWGE